MSISTTDRKAGPFIGNGVTAAFDFEFKVFSTADVLVVRTDLAGVETELTITTDYTVALNPDQEEYPGGTVTMVAVPASGIKVTLTSQVAELQQTELTNAGGFYPAVINTALDRLTILVQQLSEKVGRAVKVSISSATDPDQLVADLSAASGVATAAAETATAAAISASDSALAAEASAESLDASALMQKANNLSDVVSASAARTNLGLEIGTNVQAYDADIPTVSASQAEMEVGTEADLRSMSPLHVKQAIDALVSGGLILATPQATTSGTSKDFLSIPAGTKRITMMFNGVSTNGTANFLVQIGAGSIATTGYESLGHYSYTGSLSVASTSGFVIFTAAQASTIHGQLILCLEDSTNNIWTVSGTSSYPTGGFSMYTSGSKALSGELDRIRLTTASGTDVFDSGSVNISYE